MKIDTRWIAFFALALPIVPSQASTGSHGGGSVVCRDDSGQITRAELFDIFEARIRYRKILPSESISFEDLLHQVNDRLSDFPLIRLRFNALVQHVLDHVVDLGDEETLEPISDIAPVVIPKNCRLEQLAAYDNRHLYVRQSIYEALDPLSKIALPIHEAFYTLNRQDRENGVQSSARARELTAEVLSVNFDSARFRRLLELTMTELKPGVLRDDFVLSFDISENPAGVVVTAIEAPFTCEGAQLAPGESALLSYDPVTGSFQGSQPGLFFKIIDRTIGFFPCVGIFSLLRIQ